jgi:hypothetical protein
MSDHNPILTSLLLNPINYNNNNEFNINDRKFYKFPWNEEKFVKEFQQGIKDKMSNFEYELRLNTSAIEMSTYIEIKFKEINKIILQSARLADKNSQKQKNIYNYKKKQMIRIWTPELANISTQMNFWYSQWLISNKANVEANKNYKFYKQKFKIVQKILINNDNNKKLLNLNKIYQLEKNVFWKIVKKHKAKKRKFVKNKIYLKEFEDYYKKLFSLEDIVENESHKEINEKVNKYYNEIKESKFNIVITEDVIKVCLKKLKNNKASGNDNICNEMLKNAKCDKLTKTLSNIYEDIINHGVTLENFNISLISPIEKKDSNNTSPEDFRPISVSNVFSNIYEMLILNQITDIFTFNNKQFGYKANTSCKHAKKGGSP